MVRQVTKLRGLLLVAIAFFAVAATAQAAGPSAIGQDSQGVSYVGFASGDQLQRINASGAVLSSITLPRAGVDGIDVGTDDHVWVAFDASVVELSPTGAVLSSFARPAADSCARSGGGDPVSYGGIAVSDTAVFVSSRCGSTVETYSRAGTPTGTIAVGGRTRGIAYGAPQNGQPALLYVALPGDNKVLTYRVSSAALVNTLQLATPNGGQTPRPAGVAVDKFGQLLVSDVANHQVTFYDTNNGYSLYRTLGQGPNPGSSLGSLDGPSDLTLHAQDGGDLAGNLFIADTANQRVQRWNAYGYTFWATPAAAGQAPPAQAPTNTGLPQISGTPAVGQTLTCSNGTWTGAPTSYSYGFNRNGSYFPTDGTKNYVVQAGDAGQQISCFVQAKNDAGTSGFATSTSVTISNGGPSVPANTAAPSITGTAQQGQTVTCQDGTWTGSPSYAYVFKRGATTVGTSKSYTLTAADVGQAITCTVTATNPAGSSSATSAPITPSASGSGCPPGRLVGVTINGGNQFTNNQAVTLRITPPAGATRVVIANDGGFDLNTTQALSGTCFYTHTLDVSGTERLPKTVYVRFLGGGVNESQTFTDDIVLDKTAPTLAAPRVATSRVGGTSARNASALAGSVSLIAKSSKKAKGKKAKVRYTLVVRAKDRSSGLGKVQYASRRGAKGKTVKYRSKVRVSSRSAARWVRVFDKAGNPSAWRTTIKRSAKGKKGAAKKQSSAKRTSGARR